MKTTPILFSTPMVQAIQAGRKTMTRRMIKGVVLDWLAPDMFTPEYIGHADNNMCLYGQVGDILWVRETFYAFGYWVKNGITKTGKQAYKFKLDKNFEHNIRFIDTPPDKKEKKISHITSWYKRPSLFMPKAACRIFLKITSIKVERLHDITEADAKAEGVILIDGIGRENNKPWAMSFASLWQKINGNWDANPWVWVIEFEQNPKPLNF